MSDWVPLKDVAGWIEHRYGQRVAYIGWGPHSAPDALSRALTAGSIRARGFTLPGAECRFIPFAPGLSVAISCDWDLRLAGPTWWAVEVEEAGLASYCDSVIGPPVPAAPQLKPSQIVCAPKPRVNARRRIANASRTVSQLWPDGLPDSMAPKEAIRALADEMKRRELSVPSDTTLRRALGFRD